jgi:hypothetical protein
MSQEHRSFSRTNTVLPSPALLFLPAQLAAPLHGAKTPVGLTMLEPLSPLLPPLEGGVAGQSCYDLL